MAFEIRTLPQASRKVISADLIKDHPYILSHSTHFLCHPKQIFFLMTSNTLKSSESIVDREPGCDGFFYNCAQNLILAFASDPCASHVLADGDLDDEDLETLTR